VQLLCKGVYHTPRPTFGREIHHVISKNDSHNNIRYIVEKVKREINTDYEIQLMTKTKNIFLIMSYLLKKHKMKKYYSLSGLKNTKFPVSRNLVIIAGSSGISIPLAFSSFILNVIS